MEPVDVIVVGAGLAGLRAAQVLNASGRSVLVLERAAVVGGRLASATVDGYVLDEGFQLVNPAYPELVATGVGPDTDLRRFPAVLRYVDADTARTLTLADPRASWRDALAALGSREVARLDLARFAGLRRPRCRSMSRTPRLTVSQRHRKQPSCSTRHSSRDKPRRPPAVRLPERLDTGQRAADHERVDIGGPLVSHHRLQIHHVTDHRVLE